MNYRNMIMGFYTVAAILFAQPGFAWETKTNLTIKTVVVTKGHTRIYFNEDSGCGSQGFLAIERDSSPEYEKHVLGVALTAYSTGKPVSFYADVGSVNCSGSDYFSFAAGLPGLF